MQQKEVYIIQSNHPNGQLTKTIYDAFSKVKKDRETTEEMIERGRKIHEEIKRRYRCANQIIKDMILRDGIIQIYFDGTTEREAKVINYRINCIKRKCTDAYAKGYESQDLEKQAFLQDEQENGAAITIGTLAECNYKGVEAKIQATETGLLDRGYLLYFSIVVLEAKLQEVTHMYPMTARMRDKYIYRNMRKNAGQRSILFMGSAHQLSDFYKPNSGFAVTGVRITEQGPQYRFANRDGIPDFFREIVERRYSERANYSNI